MKIFNNNGNQQRGSSPTRTIVVLIVVALAFIAGIFVPKIIESQKYAGADKVAKLFIERIVANDPAAALELTSENFRQNYADSDIEESLQQLVSDSPKYSDPSTVRQGDQYQYYQVVDNLPPNPAGLTDAAFNLNLVRMNGEWQIAAVSIE